MAKATSLTMTDLETQEAELRAKLAEIAAQKQNFGDMIIKRNALVELCNALNECELSESLNQLEALKNEFSAIRPTLKTAYQTLFPNTSTTTKTTRKDSGGVRPMKPVAAALTGKPMTAAALHEVIKPWCDKNGWDIDQLMQWLNNNIGKKTKNGKLAVDADKYSIK